MGDNPKPKTEKELKKEAAKAAKLAKFEEKVQKRQVVATAKESGETKEKAPKKEKEIVEVIYSATTKPGEKKDVSGEMPSAYAPRYVEAAWYEWWEAEGFFRPEYGGRDLSKENPKGSFTICIPPPNVTGTLHVGHALATSVEDTLTRWNRMKGKTTLFNPGCDHAGIATQVVVEKRLQREKGLSRHDLGREKFIEEVWQWKNEKGHIIYDQLRDMGASVDWDRAVFMMDPKIMRAVTEAFIRMHESGTIYRSTRLVNWSCTLLSAISDIEVDKKELPGKTLLPVPGYAEKIEFGVIISFAYKVKDSDQELVVATTRPETMLGDTAVAVHPEDPRYKHLIGKMCQHPFVKRELPIVGDEFVDREFGTGAVKITPAHDPNDYEVGLRHKLPFITCITDDGFMTKDCGQFAGMKRFDCRKEVLDALEKLGLYREKKDNPMVVPICSRSKDIIEPILKPQWYVKCDEMARRAIEAVEQGELKITPDFHVATWNRWLQSSRDWCISRQLWWGHRIPAYFITVTDGKTPAGDPADNKYWISAHTEDEAREKAAKKFGVDPKFIGLKWDEDVLDTWFSAGMWPFAIFGWPENTGDLNAFFPGAILETGHDILFFWVARMVFMAQELTGKIPFKEVYLHAMIRDAHGRKMSKSLGNVIDPRDVIRGITLEELQRQLDSGNLDPKEIATAKAGQSRDYPQGIPECGTDALRFALMAYTSQGRDINLDVLRVQGYRFFCNKIWQAIKFTLFQLGKEYQPEAIFKLTGTESETDLWILSRCAQTVAMCEQGMVTNNFTQATTAVYNFWLYDFCDVYLESVKPVIFHGTAEAAAAARRTLYHCAETGLRLISPMMPFISEELWQRLPKRPSEKALSIVIAEYPEPAQYPFIDKTLETRVAFAMDVIRQVRSLRSDYELINKVKTELILCFLSTKDLDALKTLESLVLTLTYSSKVTMFATDDKSNKAPEKGCSRVTLTSSNATSICNIYIPLEGIIDIAKERSKLESKKGKLDGQIAKINELQAKADYETKVPLGVRANNQEKKETLEKELHSLEAALLALNV
ncbi:unnamed protein product, partial [Mesorhabditis belari]|uniref:Valine--tRNA ligase n=1 Tax=Mesorhabditis belari TaxID=2138241 RepID=A0AAF3JBP3_9BILA